MPFTFGKIVATNADHGIIQMTEDLGHMINEHGKVLMIYNQKKKTLVFFPASEHAYKITVVINATAPIVLTKVMSKARENVNRLIYGEGNCDGTEKCVWEAYFFQNDLVTSIDLFKQSLLSLPAVENVEIEKLEDT